MSKGARTRESIILIGLQVWRENPDRVNMSRVASRIGITHAGIAYHFVNTDTMKDAIADHAVRVRDPIVIADLIVKQHRAVANMPEAERMQYLLTASRG